MHLSKLFLQHMLCEMRMISKQFCIEVRLAYVIRAPLPHALLLALWDPMRLRVHCTFLKLRFQHDRIGSLFQLLFQFQQNRIESLFQSLFQF